MEATCSGKPMVRPLATIATLTVVAMAATAAWDRGGTALDRALLALRLSPRRSS